MHIDFQVYTMMVAFSAPTVLVLYLLSYWVVSKSKGFGPWNWPWRIFGFGLALLVAPFVLQWEAGSITGLEEKVSASETGFMAIVRLGFFSSVIGIMITEIVRLFWGDKISTAVNSGMVRARTSMPLVSNTSRFSKSEDAEWQVLAKHDLEVRGAVDKLKPFGERAITDLRNAYKVIGDKSQLERITSEIADEYQSKADAIARRIDAGLPTPGQLADRTSENFSLSRPATKGGPIMKVIGIVLYSIIGIFVTPMAIMPLFAAFSEGFEPWLLVMATVFGLMAYFTWRQVIREVKSK